MTQNTNGILVGKPPREHPFGKTDEKITFKTQLWMTGCVVNMAGRLNWLRIVPTNGHPFQ